jgi:hypothetical protein
MGRSVDGIKSHGERILPRFYYNQPKLFREEAAKNFEKFYVSENSRPLPCSPSKLTSTKPRHIQNSLTNFVTIQDRMIGLAKTDCPFKDGDFIATAEKSDVLYILVP